MSLWQKIADVSLEPPGKSDLTEGVEQHVPTGAWLGVDVALVEDVTVVQVPHQLQGAADTGALEAGEEREDTRQS